MLTSERLLTAQKNTKWRLARLLEPLGVAVIIMMPTQAMTHTVQRSFIKQSFESSLSAKAETIAEPVFDCGDVIGKVFDDKDSNGYQDKGEPGLPAVRLATVEGWLITTDAHGRFHVPCVMLPDQRIGSNFIVKLDTRSLPSGYRLTTENPRVMRLTAGKMTKMNFGASIGRVVRLDYTDDAFIPGTTDLDPRWSRRFTQLIAVLDQEPSILRINYVSNDKNTKLAKQRIENTKTEIAFLWRQKNRRHHLKIETRLEVQR